MIATILKFAFVGVLYAFLLWVAKSSARGLKPAGRTADRTEPHSLPAHQTELTGMHQAVSADDTARLVVEYAAGHKAGSTYDLAGEVTIGRGNVEIVIEDPFVSTRHAKIERQANLFVIEDLGSTNGTLVNGEQLAGLHPLHNGDLIQIGDNEFRFELV